MKLGRTRFYADSNINAEIVCYLRERGFKVYHASELGFDSRNDQFHLQEARHRNCVLLTRDRDFLDHRQFPFHQIRDTAIIVIGTNLEAGSVTSVGFTLLSLVGEIGASGNKNLHGLKIEVFGPRLVFNAVANGRRRRDEVDVSKPGYSKELFTDE